jgi:hypothetical protein
MCSKRHTFLDAAVDTFRELRKLTKERGHVIRSLLILESFASSELMNNTEDPLEDVRFAAGFGESSI